MYECSVECAGDTVGDDDDEVSDGNRETENAEQGEASSEEQNDGSFQELIHNFL